ncbi:MAG: glycosyltransferase [Ruminococcus sp.]|nr:glycosyltransferase [Ruminococcus sp.]
MELLSFVIPCYRSEKTIAGVVGQIIGTVEKDGRYDYEIICVNDASPDGTLDVLCQLSDGNDKITVIDLARNFGQHSAIMAGFNYVSGDIIVCLDDDGQTPPEEMFKLIDKLSEGYDMVSAKYPKKKESAFRLLGSWTAAKMGELMVGKPRGVDLNSYYAAKRFVIDETIKYTNAYPNVQGLELRATRNITNVEIEHHERLEGKSGYTLAKLIALWMNGFTAFSEKPLRIASILGIISSLAGFIFGLVIVIRRLIHPNIPIGYSSMMAVILFMFGIVLIVLGLIGEYIGRIYICINNAPQYVIRSVIKKENGPDSGSDSK